MRVSKYYNLVSISKIGIPIGKKLLIDLTDEEYDKLKAVKKDKSWKQLIVDTYTERTKGMMISEKFDDFMRGLRLVNGEVKPFELTLSNLRVLIINSLEDTERERIKISNALNEAITEILDKRKRNGFKEK